MRDMRGITLISLIVAIIVLLILSGIAISTLMGENGIINRAIIASKNTKRESARERLQVELLDIKSEKIANGENVSLIVLDDKIQDLSQKGIYVAKEGNPRKVTLDGYTFNVNDDLIIDGDGNNSGDIGDEDGSCTNPPIASQIDFYGGTINTIFSGGEGSENNPYLIENAQQLRIYAAIVNYGYNTYEGKYIKLVNDIILDNTKQWIPIGNDTTKFNGIFDGNGKTISGININNTLNNQGLFGVLGNTGVIKNLTIQGTIKGGACTGGIVGTNSGGTIDKCKNKVTVINGGNFGAYGGIVGYNIGKVSNSCNLVQITGNDSTGGIAGQNLRNGIIEKCYNLGTITASGTGSAFGGIAGYNGNDSGNGYIYNSYNNAIVTGTSWVGGIAGNMGYNSGKGCIYNSYTIKNTTIVGENMNNSIITNCYTTNANMKLTELNAGIDMVNGTDTEQPWVEDKNNENDGYPILNWQNK